MKQILQQHAQRFIVDDDDFTPSQRVNARRTNVVDDAMNQCRRSSFNLEQPFSVRFLGEPAVDVGGPKRELFRLFLQGLNQKPN